MIDFTKEQKEILKYTSGNMCISAVPGAGKTFILTHLAYNLSKTLKNDEQILVLTYMNSATFNFYNNLKNIDKNISNIQVKTIHKFCLDLIKENINLININSDFTLIDSKNYGKIISDLFKIWFHKNKENLSFFFKNNNYNKDVENDFIFSLKISLQKFISTCKNYSLSPKDIQSIAIKNNDSTLILLNSFYIDYQDALKKLEFLDYDDLLMISFNFLKSNQNIKEKYQKKFKYILEDEAQDSNILQNRILNLITNKNFVKSGDSNQNITGSFTLSSPKIFTDFYKNSKNKKNLTISKRSKNCILEISNEFIRWAYEKHPVLSVRNAFFLSFFALGEEFLDKKIKRSKKEIVAFNDELKKDEFINCFYRVKKTIKKLTDKSIGIICYKNSDIYELAKLFDQENIKYNILNDFDTSNLELYKKLADFINFIDNPNNINLLIKILETHILKKKLTKIEIKKIYAKNFYEEYFYLDIKKIFDLLNYSLNSKEKVLVYISQNFNFNPHEIEIIENISLNLKSIFKFNPKWTYSDLAFELKQVENNKFNYFNWNTNKKNKEKEQISISTYHKSKGREWDIVFLLGLNENNFPVFTHKEQIGEAFYINDNVKNIDFFVTNSIKKYLETNSLTFENYKEEKIKESLRIIYVGLTRAKEYLFLSCNKEESGTFYFSLFSELIKKLKL